MRRSGSSSCMLRPRHSSGSLVSLGGGGEEGDHHQQQQLPPLSVTMISREELPSFSTERFFMLSEFHLNSHSMRFVSDLQETDELTPQTVDTAASSNVSAADAASGGITQQPQPQLEDFQNDNADSFPPYLIFYLLWRPDMTRNVEAFTSDIILPSVQRIQSHVDVALSDEDKRRSASKMPNSPSSGRLNLIEAEQQQQPDLNATASSQSREHDSVAGSSSLSSSENGKTRLYLVVERTAPYNRSNDAGGSDADTNNSVVEQKKPQRQPHDDVERRRSHFERETDVAENLAKHVASHSQLRSLFQGITIGVANHKRAAPGLDACVDVINYGARDRRKVGRDVRSHVGLISLGPDDLLGLDEEGETDGAQNVLQTRISTEWNGRGNLKSFGYRAHSMWRRDSGLPPQSPAGFPLGKKEAKRRLTGSGRRLGRLDEELESFPLDLFLNMGAFLLIAYYVWQGLTNGGVH